MPEEESYTTLKAVLETFTEATALFCISSFLEFKVFLSA